MARSLSGVKQGTELGLDMIQSNPVLIIGGIESIPGAIVGGPQNNSDRLGA
jgi:branched-subunit amino acid ABC-type transport system permease component